VRGLVLVGFLLSACRAGAGAGRDVTETEAGMRAIRFNLLLALASLAASVGPLSATAQTADICAWDGCGLRFDGRTLLQGVEAERVGGFGMLYADLAILTTGPDTAAVLARSAQRAKARSAYVLLGMHAGTAMSLALLITERNDVLAPPFAVTYGVTLGASFLVGHLQRRAMARAAEAAWWYNRGVAAGEVPLAAELPPPDPPNHARAGLYWGIQAGQVAAILTQGYARANSPTETLVRVGAPLVASAAGRLPDRAGDPAVSRGS
jgi:hypothetical protein